jgi:hypothetical protein
VGVGGVGGFRGAAEGVGHDFCFAEEESVLCVSLEVWRLERGRADRLSGKSERTCLRNVLRMLWTEKTKQYWYLSRDSWMLA